MLGRWRRVGNYSELNTYNEHAVSFVADSLAAIITRIDICYVRACSRPAYNEITLLFSPVFANELVKVCESLETPYRQKREDFSQYSDCSDPNESSFFNIYFGGVTLSATIYSVHETFDQNTLTRLMKLFEYFNQKMQPHPFPQELLAELNNIYKTASQGDIAKHKHIMPDSYIHQAKPLFPWPERKSLSVILAGEENPDEFIANLIEGDDPNEAKYLYLPLTYAVLRQRSKRALEVLLVYDADPFRRPLKAYWKMPYFSRKGKEYAIESFSAYELAFAFGQREKGRLIIDEFSWLTRRIIPGDDTRKKLTVTQARSEYSDNAVTSEFHFSSQRSIYTRLMKIDYLNRKEMGKEKKSIFELFKSNFEAADDVTEHKLMDMFASDFSGDKYIDIIYDESRVIGFNLFEIVNPKNHQYVTFVHCAYAAIAPEYRGFGLMTFLSSRLAYIMQLIHPERQMGVYFSALHYNSYRLVLDFKHYPKFQSAVMDSIIKDILDTIYPESYRYHHLLTYYIVDSLRVKTSRADNHKLSLNERIYSREILGLDDAQRMKVKNRAAPVAFMVGDDNTLFMRNVARQHGIDFDAHIAEYTKLLLKLMHPDAGSDHVSVTKFSVFMRKSDALFSPAATLADTNRPSKSVTKL